MRKAGEEEDWKKKTRDRGGWKILSDEAVKRLRAAPHPSQRERRKRKKLTSVNQPRFQPSHKGNRCERKTRDVNHTPCCESAISDIHVGGCGFWIR